MSQFEFKDTSINGQDVRVFTTLASYTVPEPSLFYFDKHLNRVLGSAQELGILNESIQEHQREYIQNTSLDKLREFHNDHNNRAKLRIEISTNGTEIEVSPYQNIWDKTDSIKTVSFKSERPLPKHKTMFTEVCLKARKFAEENGYNEAILIDDDQTIREGAWSNIFWINQEKQIFTTKDKILPGVTKQAILENFECIEKNCSKTELLDEAVEMFITQSTSGVIPVSSFDDKTFTTELSSQIRSKFEEIVKRDSKAIPLG